jgi:hypothetical protein
VVHLKQQDVGWKEPAVSEYTLWIDLFLVEEIPGFIFACFRFNRMRKGGSIHAEDEDQPRRCQTVQDNGFRQSCTE